METRHWKGSTSFRASACGVCPCHWSGLPCERNTRWDPSQNRQRPFVQWGSADTVPLPWALHISPWSLPHAPPGGSGPAPVPRPLHLCPLAHSILSTPTPTSPPLWTSHLLSVLWAPQPASPASQLWGKNPGLARIGCMTTARLGLLWRRTWGSKEHPTSPPSFPTAPPPQAHRRARSAQAFLKDEGSELPVRVKRAWFNTCHLHPKAGAWFRRPAFPAESCWLCFCWFRLAWRGSLSPRAALPGASSSPAPGSVGWEPLPGLALNSA